MARWEFYDDFPPSRPLAAKGGIRAQSKRGAFGESWWARRWVSVLDSFHISGRLGRGRSYARSGQVLSIEIAKGRIGASVQGSRPAPYQVSIGLKPLGPKEWKSVAKAVCAQAIFASKLLAGEMPQEIEEAFRSAGVSLFPSQHSDLKTQCSCPDWSNPCKHIAAVYYLLGEEFDRDPFLIFRLRGMEREEFVALLGEGPARTNDVCAPSEPLPADPGEFWAARELPPDVVGEPPVAPAGAALARRLGFFPFWRGTVELMEFLEPVYRRASERAAGVLERQSGTGG
jgi:uncharacterized Zn finger protein